MFKNLQRSNRRHGSVSMYVDEQSRRLNLSVRVQSHNSVCWKLGEASSRSVSSFSCQVPFGSLCWSGSRAELSPGVWLFCLRLKQHKQWIHVCFRSILSNEWSEFDRGFAWTIIIIMMMMKMKMPHDFVLFTFCLPRICDVIVLEIIALFNEGVGNKPGSWRRPAALMFVAILPKNVIKKNDYWTRSSLEGAGVWMDWTFTDSNTGSEGVWSQQRLGTLELGPARPVGTLPWCQNGAVRTLHPEGLETCWRLKNESYFDEKSYSVTSGAKRSFCAVTC